LLSRFLQSVPSGFSISGVQHEHRGLGWAYRAIGGWTLKTGVFMLLYLDLAYEQAKKEGRLRSLPDLQETIRYGAVKRLRPKFMTVSTTFLGLVPIMWSIGAGSDMMKRVVAPMVGGLATSFRVDSQQDRPPTAGFIASSASKTLVAPRSLHG
jgi:hypothetical protein